MLWTLNLPEFMVPTRLEKVAYFERLNNACDYGEGKSFQQCEGNNGKIYVGFALGVARSQRGKGLGGVLLRESIKFAKEKGCSHQYLLATGIYSQAIMANNGFITLKEMPYSDVKDRHGTVIVDHPVHKTMKVMTLKIE